MSAIKKRWIVNEDYSLITSDPPLPIACGAASSDKELSCIEKAILDDIAAIIVYDIVQQAENHGK
jgi:hypothetical protein